MDGVTEDAKDARYTSCKVCSGWGRYGPPGVRRKGGGRVVPEFVPPMGCPECDGTAVWSRAQYVAWQREQRKLPLNER